MFFKKKVYPILPTTESDTMTFIQKLDYLEYKVNELNEKVVAAESAISDLETAVEGKSTVTATAEGSTLQTLTVDGTSYNVPQGTEVSATGDDGVLQTLTIGDDTYTVPQGTEVSATGDDGVLQTLTIGDDTYTVPQGGDAGIHGDAIMGTSMTTRASWKRVDDMFFFMIYFVNNSDAFSDNTISLRLIDSNGNNYGGLDGGLDGNHFKTVISWLHTDNGNTWPVWAEVELEVFVDGAGNLKLPKGAHVLTGDTPLAGGEVLDDLKGKPLTFMIQGVL